MSNYYNQETLIELEKQNADLKANLKEAKQFINVLASYCDNPDLLSNTRSFVAKLCRLIPTKGD
jgi:hypothetical protein